MSAHDHEPNTGREARDRQPRAFDGTRILVVDDEPESRSAIAAMLAQAGARVETAGGGVEALRLVRRWRPLLIVSDLMMADGDGYFLISRVRALPIGRAVAAVVVSGAATARDRERTRAAGFDAHLAKPVDSEELIAVLSELARASRRAER